MHQLLLGACIPLVIGLMIYLVRGCRASLRLLMLLPPTMVIGSIWAVAPDIPRIIGWHSLYQRLQIPAANIFFWHYSIDRMEAAHLDAMAPIFNIIALLLPLILLGMAWRELYLTEKNGGRD